MKHKPTTTYRQCNTCGKTYWRSSRMRIWVTRQLAGKMVFMKEDVKLCLSCLPAKQAERVMSVAHVTVTPLRMVK